MHQISDVCRPTWADSDPLLTEYYDTEWGMPVLDDVGMFERLTLEAFQSGLSWLTVLRKRPAFRDAFEGFEPNAVAAYTESDIERLLGNPGIIRNRRKIEDGKGYAHARSLVSRAGGGGKPRPARAAIRRMAATEE